MMTTTTMTMTTTTPVKQLDLENDFYTPQKQTFQKLVPQTVCFSCGEEKVSRQMRLVKNVALNRTYHMLIKECFMVVLPENCLHRICVPCLNRMQKTVIWRREAVGRLKSWSSMKRSHDSPSHSISTFDVPAVSIYSTPVAPPVDDFVPLSPSVAHTYSRKTVGRLSEEARVSRRNVKHPTARKTLQDSYDSEDSLVEKLVAQLKESSDMKDLVSSLMLCKEAKGLIEDHILDTMDSSITMLNSTEENSSVLTTFEDNSDILELAIIEMNRKVPFLFRVLVTASATVESKKGLFLGIIYGMLLRQRSQRMNAIQRLLTATCLRYHAGNQLLEVLANCNLTLAESSKSHFLTSISGAANKELIPLIASGRDCKVTIDNIDGRLIANQVRLKSGNRDYHHTHWTILPDRFDDADLVGLNPETPQRVDPPPPSLFYCTGDENARLREACGLVMAKILCSEIEELRPLRNCVPSSLQHRWSEVTSRKSCVFSQPIILEDSKFLPSCVRILGKVVEDLSDIYTKAGRGEEFKSGAVTVTVGGDQLTRTHLDSAKNLRAGTHTPTQRLSQLMPIVEECFHIQQDLLEEIYKRFYISGSGRQPGTLNHLRSELHRTNVNGNVKANSGYEGHKDFAVLVARMLVVELYHEKIALQLPQHIKHWSNEKKLEWVLSMVEPLVDILYVPFEEPSAETIPMLLQYDNRQVLLQFPPHLAGKTHQVVINGLVYQINIPGPVLPVKENDELYNYTVAFARSMMDFIVFDNILKAGDIERLAPMLKRLIPTFIGLTSFRSKYAIEAVNTLTKTEWSLSEVESVKAKLRAFVNLEGRNNRNKSADMQQEINIKQVKTVVRSLGACKSDNAMVRSSQAAPGITSMAENFRKSLGLTESDSGYRHHKKDDTEDKEVVREVLSRVRPFHVVVGRVFGFELEDSVFHSVDKFKLADYFKRNSKRAMGQCVFDDEDEEEEETE